MTTNVGSNPSNALPPGLPSLIPGGTGLPNGTAATVNYALYLVLYAQKHALQDGLDKKQTDIVKLEQLLNSVDGSVLDLMNVLNQFEDVNVMNVQQLWNIVQHSAWFSSLTKMIGPNFSFDSSGNLIPDPNSALGQYIADAKAQNPSYDYTQDAIYQRVNELVGWMHTTTPTGYYYDDQGWHGPQTGPDNLLALSFVYELVELVCNHWLVTNPQSGFDQETDYLPLMWAKSSVIDNTASGVDQQNVTILQQYASDEKTIVQVLQDAVKRSADTIANSLNLSKKT